VLYLCDRHEPGDPEFDAWGAHNVAGTEGAEVWPELAPREGDAVVPHRTYSGFAGTELERELRARGVDTVVLTGCITEIHLFVTAADAMMRGFGVEVPPDCQAGSSPLAEAVALSALSVMRPLEPMPAAP
jgi:nicotinamidase-related amidase